MRVAIVDGDRLVKASRHVELSAQRVALGVGWRQVAEEVEADLADRRDVRLRGQLLEGLPLGLRRGSGIVRMDADGARDEIWISSRELDGGAGAVEIPTRDEDADDPRLAGAPDDLVAVGVEGRVLEMTVGVDEPRQTLGDSWAQDATPLAPISCIGLSGGLSSIVPPRSGNSARGRIGSARPVRQGCGPAPHVSSDASPGPPLPRSSYGTDAPSCSPIRRPAAGANGAMRCPSSRQDSAMTASTWPSRSRLPSRFNVHGACDSAKPFAARAMSIIAAIASSKCSRFMAA
jgi:hypothetical protein